MRTSKWPVATDDADFELYVAGKPASSVALFWRFVAMARACGPVTFELQNGPVVLCGSRRIFASVAVAEKGLTGHLNLPRPLDDTRIRRASPLTARLWMNGYVIIDPSQLDDAFVEWLREARDVGDGILPAR